MHSKINTCVFCAALVFAGLLLSSPDACAAQFPLPQDAYPKCDGLWRTLVSRVKMSHMNLYATIIFACAVVHTFSYQMFLKFADTVKKQQKRFKLRDSSVDIAKRILSLLGEVEIVFALWLIPLFAIFYYECGWHSLTDYLNNLAYAQDKYSEPVFVMVVMCMAATRPVIYVAAKFVSLFAALGGKTVRAWWISIMCVGPILGSLITEPAAITICAILLLRHFFDYTPSIKFKYATIGLLFVSVSLGGALTHFSAPPIIMVARSWGWDTPFMIAHFGWKSVLVIFASTFVYAFLFRREFVSLENNRIMRGAESSIEKPPPNWIIGMHLLFLIAAVAVMHYLVLEMFLLLAFIAFVDITQRFQWEMKFRSPMLVAIFLGALVTHGSLQTWWLEPILERLDSFALFAGGVLLTSFNDNAAITYLASLVPSFADETKYLIVAAAISGGGLTVIANAPNLVGLSVLKEEFRNGVSPKLLLEWSIVPTLLACAAFFYL